MNGLYITKFYSSNTDIVDSSYKTVHTPLKTDVLALADIEVTQDYDLQGYYAGISLETDNKVFPNGARLAKNTQLKTFNIKCMPYDFPTSEINLDTLISSAFVAKKYKWIDLGEYPFRPEALLGVTTKLLAVNLVTGSLEDNGNGTKTLTFTFEER